MWLFHLTTFSQADGISSSMSKRKPGNYLLDWLMLGWKCKELENNDDFVFPWLCLQMFWCRKRFAWMTKKKFSFHFSGERIKLQKFGLSFKMKVPKTALESRIDSLLYLRISLVIKKIGGWGKGKKTKPVCQQWCYLVLCSINHQKSLWLAENVIYMYTTRGMSSPKSSQFS